MDRLKLGKYIIYDVHDNNIYTYNLTISIPKVNYNKDTKKRLITHIKRHRLIPNNVLVSGIDFTTKGNFTTIKLSYTVQILSIDDRYTYLPQSNYLNKTIASLIFDYFDMNIPKQYLIPTHINVNPPTIKYKNMSIRFINDRGYNKVFYVVVQTCKKESTKKDFTNTYNKIVRPINAKHTKFKLTCYSTSLNSLKALANEFA